MGQKHSQNSSSYGIRIFTLFTRNTMNRILSVAIVLALTATAGASGPPELLTKLQKIVSLKDAIDAPLDLALADLADQHGLNAKFLLDVTAFKDAGLEDVKAANVKLDKLEGVKLQTILEALLKQVQGTFFVRETHIEITTKAERRIELNLRDDHADTPHRENLPLVRQTFTETSLRTAVEELAKRYDKTIIVSPHCADKADATMSAKFVNVPLDSVVEMLADMADLVVVKKANAYYITTPERVKK